MARTKSSQPRDLGGKAPRKQLASSNPGSDSTKLTPGKSITSKNGLYSLVMETAGKGLNLYSTAPMKLLWTAPGTKIVEGGPLTAELRPNGSLAVLQGAKVVWATGDGPGLARGPFTFSITDNGMLALEDKSGHKIWHTGPHKLSAFAAKQWSPLLGVNVDTATSDSELMKKLTNGTPYEAFFFAPGQCSLIRSGRVDVDAVIKVVRSHHPNIPILYIEDISKAVPMLAEALALDQSLLKTELKPLTQDWPFVD